MTVATYTYRGPAEPSSPTGRWLEIDTVDHRIMKTHAARRGLVRTARAVLVLVGWKEHGKVRLQHDSGQRFTAKKSDVLAVWAETREAS